MQADYSTAPEVTTDVVIAHKRVYKEGPPGKKGVVMNVLDTGEAIHGRTSHLFTQYKHRDRMNRGTMPQ